MAKTRSAINMSARWLERLRPPESGRVEYFDADVHGLGLRVSATGHMAWLVLYRVRGDSRLKRLTMMPYPQMSLADARERARAVLLDASRGADPAAEKQVELNAPTFEMVAKEYILRYAKGAGEEPRKRTWKRDETMLEKEVIPYWGRKKIHEIRRKDVNDLLDRVVDQGKPIKANRLFAVIRKLFKWALGRDYIQVSPCYGVEAPSRENQRDRVLSEREIRLVWRSCDGITPVMSDVLRLLLLTAQRRGEVLSMRWEDIDLDTAWWTVPSTSSKNKLSHRVPLSARAIAILQRRHEETSDSPWVFPSPRRSTGKHIESIQKAVDELRGACGVDFVVHDLRRTVASHMTSIGIPRLVVSKILNHVEAGITRVYDRHSYDAEKRKALDEWAGRLEVLVASDRGKQGKIVHASTVVTTP